MLTSVHNNADDADAADDIDDADDIHDHNRVIGIAQLMAFSCANKSPHISNYRNRKWSRDNCRDSQDKDR